MMTPLQIKVELLCRERRGDLGKKLQGKRTENERGEVRGIFLRGMDE